MYVAVTGAAAGIGKAIAREYGAIGVFVRGKELQSG